ncbi:MAG: hypothetical protein ACI4V3_10540 [Faecousia sp.]
MDAMSNASFINRIAAGELLPCPKCGAVNKGKRNKCFFCGADFCSTPDGVALQPADSSVTDAVRDKPQADPAKAGAAAGADAQAAPPAKPYVEPPCAFAKGLPEWSVEPPQMAVRRRR